MYVKPGCPYCEGARERLSADGLDWEERDATTRSDWREELFSYSPGGKTIQSASGLADFLITSVCKRQ